MQISDSSIDIIGDNGKEIVKLLLSQILTVQDNQSGITINTKEGALNLNFYNVRKGGIMMLLLGPLLTSNSKNSPLSSKVQDQCRRAISSLSEHGYKLNQ
jgi:aspartate/tyrosine/aromatic aminotransferase